MAANGASAWRQLTPFPLYLAIFFLLGANEVEAATSFSFANECSHPVFKAACPAAYSYAYDDASSTFTCSGAATYHITFCPAT
ncbi:unnamed protein product [Triticum turgidum subsp. durum]|uniref:Thaumatin-like protein n=1 Tax=Triticum turgidum subsp. durum TaxID=4567 RepID=A0A9R0UIL5_TRITD|nr:unnamed protein product [Triticum turgidum subsp. durum]